MICSITNSNQSCYFILLKILCELVEGSIGRVVSYQKIHVLIGDLHRAWMVHYVASKKCERACLSIMGKMEEEIYKS